MLQLSEHFTLEELTASQTATRFCIDNTPSSSVITNLKQVCQLLLEPIRAHFNLPVIISSGYRSIKVNQKIGGSGSSQHCTGNAVDFTISGISISDTVNYVYSSGLVYDQLIHEGTWTHISYSSVKNRQQTLQATFTDGKASYTPYRKNE